MVEGASGVDELAAGQCCDELQSCKGEEDWDGRRERAPRPYQDSIAGWDDRSRQESPPRMGESDGVPEVYG